jgi:hypothetical protein
MNFIMAVMVWKCCISAVMPWLPNVRTDCSLCILHYYSLGNSLCPLTKMIGYMWLQKKEFLCVFYNAIHVTSEYLIFSAVCLLVMTFYGEILLIIKGGLYMCSVPLIVFCQVISSVISWQANEWWCTVNGDSLCVFSWYPVLLSSKVFEKI